MKITILKAVIVSTLLFVFGYLVCRIENQEKISWYEERNPTPTPVPAGYVRDLPTGKISSEIIWVESPKDGANERYVCLNSENEEENDLETEPTAIVRDGEDRTVITATEIKFEKRSVNKETGEVGEWKVVKKIIAK